MSQFDCFFLLSFNASESLLCCNAQKAANGVWNCRHRDVRMRSSSLDMQQAPAFCWLGFARLSNSV